jgi:hypothetical protein
MRKFALLFALLFIIPGLIRAQEYVVNTYDEAPADTNYWMWYDVVMAGSTEEGPGGHYSTNTNAHPDTGWINISYVGDPVSIGTGAMQLEYSAHNKESWGGYSKIEHWHPDTNAVYDFSAFDSISFMYYNAAPQSLTGRVHLRLCLHDVSDSPNGFATYTNEECEYYYSFQYILDNAPGWQELKMPLTADPNNWSTAQGFNLTGWAGITGNQTLDLDKIKGYAVEFSISGGGEGDFSAGTIVLDHLALKGAASVELVFFNGRNIPPTVSVGAGWGGGTYEVTDEEASTPGTNSIKWTTPPEDWALWDGITFSLASPKNLFVNWPTDSVRMKIKAPAGIGDLQLKFIDPDDDGAGPDLPFEANYMLTEAEAGYDGTWREVNVALDDFDRYGGGWDGTQMQPGWFDSTRVNQFMVQIPTTAAINKVIYLDDIWTGDPEIDVIAPAQVLNVVPYADEYFNLVSWDDVEGENGEAYNIYASKDPITDINAPNVDVVAKSILENNQVATHFIYYPLQDKDVSYFYAVECVDAAGNIGPFGTSPSALTNTALAMPTISLSPPGDFVADGFFDEWDNSGIMPFVVMPETGTVPQGGEVTDSLDLKATIYLAIDDTFLYVAADVIDDVYYWTGTGNWYDHDAFQMFFGLYDWRGPNHNAVLRGEEPDYILYFVEERLQRDNPGNITLYTPEDANYHFEELGGADYILEAKIPLDSLVDGDDQRFHPVRGMRIPIDLYFHDNDGAGWEGNVGLSPFGTDLQWQNPGEWVWTWIGDTTDVATGIDRDENSQIAREFNLQQNYPNPFNPTTTIEYAIGDAGHVSLKIYNILGQVVKTLVDKKQVAGAHQVDFDGRDLASGVYFYTLKSGSFVKTQKMVLLK